MKARNKLPAPEILGRRMQPYTIGHDLLLHSIDSGFAIGAENDPTYDDLLTSIYLCSFPFSEAIAELASKYIHARLEWWGWRNRKHDLGATVTRFISYLKAYTDAPDFWVVGATGKPSKQLTPFSQTLRVEMVKEFNMSDDEALNTPYHIAQWNYLTAQELAGRINFKTDADKKAVEIANDPEFHNRLAAISATMKRN